MNRKIIVVTAIVSLILFAGIVVYGSVKITGAYQSEYVKAQAGFSSLIASVKAIGNEALPLRSKVSALIPQYINSQGNIEFVAFYDRYIGYEYLYPSDSPLLVVPYKDSRPFTGRVELKLDFLRHQSFEASLDSAGFTNMSIIAVVNLPSFDALYPTLRDCFIALLFIVLVLGIELIITMATKNETIEDSAYIPINKSRAKPSEDYAFQEPRSYSREEKPDYREPPSYEEVPLREERPSYTERPQTRESHLDVLSEIQIPKMESSPDINIEADEIDLPLSDGLDPVLIDSEEAAELEPIEREPSPAYDESDTSFTNSEAAYNSEAASPIEDIPEIDEDDFREQPGREATTMHDPQDILHFEQPRGLFSPHTGLGWEQYFLERLEAELQRSASFEQDLSLALIDIEGLVRGSDSDKLVADTIIDFFSFRDLSFELGDSDFAVIIPNLDVERALRMMEECLKKLTFLFHERGGYGSGLSFIPIFIGLSSRSGRLTNAELLIDEAGLALEKAKSERDTRLVAFKPNADRYREYLATQDK